MKTRKKGYEDYGFSKEEAKRLIKRCKSLNHEDADLLHKCALRATPVDGEAIYYSLIHGLSYEKTCLEVYPHYCKTDFYGYRRKALALFREALIGRSVYDKRRTRVTDTKGNRRKGEYGDSLAEKL